MKLRKTFRCQLCLELLLAGELVVEVPHVLGTEAPGLGVVRLVVGDLVDLVLVQPLPPVAVRAPLLPRVPVLSRPVSHVRLLEATTSWHSFRDNQQQDKADMRESS